VIVCRQTRKSYCHIVLRLVLLNPQSPNYFKITHYYFYYVLFSLALQPSAVYGFLVSRGFLITHNVAPQSVGLLWTSDQLVAETSNWHNTTHTTDKHQCPHWDSNPRLQQASGHRPTTYTARPLEPAKLNIVRVKSLLQLPIIRDYLVACLFSNFFLGISHQKSNLRFVNDFLESLNISGESDIVWGNLNNILKSSLS
jgi:hypothetical protein